MPVDVGERVHVGVGRLGGLAQDQPAGRLQPRDVAALAVRGRPLGHLGDVGQALGRDPGEDPRVQHRPEVVRVGHERVAVAALQQRREHARGEQRRVDVAVPRRAPLQRRIRRPLRRRQPVGEQLRLLVLDEVERDVGRQPLVALEQRERVVARVERVHQHERDPRAARLAQRQHLARDHVEEREPLLDLQQRLRAAHPHRRAEPAVELDHDRLVERGVRAGERLGVGQVADRLDLVLADQPGLARLELLVVVREGGDRRVRDPVPAHLLLGRPQPLLAHGADPSQPRR